jgi:hypothetical protein
MLGDSQNKFLLQNIVKHFFSSQPEMKKLWKKKSKALMKKYDFEHVNAEEEVVEEEEELLNKKQKREVEKKSTDKKKNGKAKVEDSIEISNGNGHTDKFKTQEAKVPFKRISDSYKEVLPESLKDNSYEGFLAKSGNDYGREANEKLKFTKGRDFRKEKTKFKNKITHGGLNITMDVKSIPLDSD